MYDSVIQYCATTPVNLVYKTYSTMRTFYHVPSTSAAKGTISHRKCLFATNFKVLFHLQFSLPYVIQQPQNALNSWWI